MKLRVHTIRGCYVAATWKSRRSSTNFNPHLGFMFGYTGLIPFPNVSWICIYIWLIVYIYIARYSVKSHFLICFRKSIFSTINSTSFDDPTISHLHSEDRLHDSDFSHAPPWAIGAHWGHRFMSLLEKHQTWGINCWTCGEIDQWGPIYGSSHMVLSES